MTENFWMQLNIMLERSFRRKCLKKSGYILKYILFNILQYVRYFNVPQMTIQTISDEKPRELSYDEKQNYIKSVTMDEFSLALHEINTRYESIRESDFEREKKILELEIKVEQLKIAKLKE